MESVKIRRIVVVNENILKMTKTKADEKKPVRKLPDDLEDLKFTGNPKEDIKLMNLLIDAWQKVLADEKKY